MPGLPSARPAPPVRVWQEGATGFFAVWDHWLLDTLSSWQKQAESNYAITLEDEREPSPPGRLQEEALRLASDSGPGTGDSLAVAAPTADEVADLPPRKRARSEDDGAGIGTLLQQLQPATQQVVQVAANGASCV